MWPARADGGALVEPRARRRRGIIRGDTMTLPTLLLLIVCAIAILAVLGVSIFLVLIKLGIIVREASRPAYQDAGDYGLDQGREIRPEEERL
jgi:hypothetical protein